MNTDTHNRINFDTELSMDVKNIILATIEKQIDKIERKIS